MINKFQEKILKEFKDLPWIISESTIFLSLVDGPKHFVDCYLAVYNDKKLVYYYSNGSGIEENIKINQIRKFHKVETSFKNFK